MDSSGHGSPSAHAAAQPAGSERGELPRGFGSTDVILDVAVDPGAQLGNLAGEVSACHRAGQRIIVVTAVDAATALGRSRELGIVGPVPVLLQGWEIEQMPAWDIEVLLARSPEIVVAATSTAATQRIADVLQQLGRTVITAGGGPSPARV